MAPLPSAPQDPGDPLAPIFAGLAQALVPVFAALGENPGRPGLADTPARYVRALRELLSGYAEDPQAALATRFPEGFDQMIWVRNIPFSSLCEHHLLPFTGTVTLGYIPGAEGDVVGLSKIPRLVRILSRRLQVQERLTQQIADTFNEAMTPQGVGVVVIGEHSCMRLRGIESSGTMETSCLIGAVRHDPRARAEFLSAVHL